MGDAIYVGNKQQTLKKRMDGHFCDVQKLLKTGQKLDSFAAHYEQHLNSSRSRTTLCTCMMFEVDKQLNSIGEMKTFTKPNRDMCMDGRTTILRKLRDKHITVMKKNLEMYVACQYKVTFRRFCLGTDDHSIG